MRRLLSAYARSIVHLSPYQRAAELVHVCSVLYVPTTQCLRLLKRVVNHLSVNVNP